jgi:hypothetical protein
VNEQQQVANRDAERIVIDLEDMKQVRLSLSFLQHSPFSPFPPRNVGIRSRFRPRRPNPTQHPTLRQALQPSDRRVHASEHGRHWGEERYPRYHAVPPKQQERSE